MSATVSAADVARVAELAHLELSEPEITSLQRDLNAILAHVAELNELDTTGVEELAQVSELLPEGADNVLRADAVKPSLNRAAVLAEAPDASDAFFKVPKVLDK